MSGAKHTPGQVCDECEGFCLKKPGVIAALSAIDDHLQGLQHYGHSHELREAMAAVQNLLDTTAPLFNRNATIYANEITLPMASHAAAMRALREVRAAIDKATGSTS